MLRPVTLLLAVLVGALLIEGGYALTKRQSLQPAVGPAAPSTASPVVAASAGSTDTNSGNAAKTQISPSPQTSPSPTSPAALPTPTDKVAPTAEPDTQTSSLTISLIRAGQVDRSIQFRAYVSGVTTGSCSVSYADGSGHRLSKDGSVTLEPNGSADCADTDIAVADFPSSGVWTGTLTATSGRMTSNVLTQQVTVTK